jgi:polyhydroxybutyrate depolymerase
VGLRAEEHDITYLGNLLTHVEGSLCVDERRVFVTGLSMGSFTTSAIACEMAGRIAAVAPVAGLQAFPWCKPARAVPVVAFQGTADPYVSYIGGWSSTRDCSCQRRAIRPSQSPKS